MHRENRHMEREMSTADLAEKYVKRMLESETRGWGDQSAAMGRIEQKYGIPYWSMDRIRTGRAKTCEAGLFQRIRAAYLDMCERQISKLQHEVAIERAVWGDDDTGNLDVLEDEIRALAHKVRSRQQGRGVK